MPRPGDILPPPSALPDKDRRAAIADLVARLPAEPGCYLMKDQRGKIFYVGKAADLRGRVRSYFSGSDTRAFVPLLGRILADIETIVTRNEKEALLLENNLIKQHQPRFNVNLRDDKNYLVLRLDPRARYPRLEVVRHLGDDGARYFGPYHSATSCRETLRVVNRHFQLRTCSDQDMASRTRPCLQYQIKRCSAPCVLPVPEGEYATQVDDVTLFLQGKDRDLLERLQERMREASDALDFERAAQLRDRLLAVERTLTDQRVVSSTFVDQDVFGLYREGERLDIAVLHVRQGKLLGRRTYSFSAQTFPDEEGLSSFLGLYYDLGSYVPDEVLLPIDLPDAATHADALRERPERGGRKVDVLTPRRGPRVELVGLANKNAEMAFQATHRRDEDALASLEKLQRRLRLRRVPRRIECYDISHLGGTLPVASMVVFTNGLPDKAAYRRFKLRSVTNDDFAAMHEVLTRRFKRAQGAESGWAPPDLVVIDGGKGQLGAALAALADLGFSTAEGPDVVALAKERTSFARRLRSRLDRKAGQSGPKSDRAASTPPGLPAEPALAAELELAIVEPAAVESGLASGSAEGVVAAPASEAPLGEELGRGSDGGDGSASATPTKRRGRETVQLPDRVFLPRIKDPIRLQSNTAELFLLARIRDEAHRFAVTFQRSLRGRQATRSALLAVPGIGATRAKRLLRHLGSVRAVRQASIEEIAAAPGMSRAAAEAVWMFFHDGAGARIDDFSSENGEKREDDLPADDENGR